MYLGRAVAPGSREGTSTFVFRYSIVRHCIKTGYELVCRQKPTHYFKKGVRVKILRKAM